MWPHKFSVSNAAAAREKVLFLPVGDSLQETLLAPSTDGELAQPPVDSDAMLQLRLRGPRNVELHRFGCKQQAIRVEFITLVAIISVQSLASKISSATTRYVLKNSQVMPRNCPWQAPRSVSSFLSVASLRLRLASWTVPCYTQSLPSL